ncbi:hypothetical protein [Azospirillum brasilense]|nr:hypothetical protein [Azospirillum brasilense]
MGGEAGGKIDADFTDLGTDFTEFLIRASYQPQPDQPHWFEQFREILL